MSRHEPLVSIVVPTYNRVGYLRECLDSLLRQTYRNIEIVVTDDGSTDGTESFVKDIAQKNQNIVFVQNRAYPKGPNGNKNNGLDHANGDIVGILDDDDTLRPDAIRLMIEKIEQGYDIVMANCIRSDNQKLSGIGLKESGEVDWRRFFCGEINGEFWSLFKKNILGTSRFDVDLCGGEGVLWREIMKSRKIFYIHSPLREYRIHTSSVTRDAIVSASKVIVNYERDIEYHGNEMKKYCPCYLASIHKGAAYFAKLSSQYKRGFKHLIKSLMFCPRYTPSYIMLFVFFLPKRIVLLLIRWRVRMQK